MKRYPVNALVVNNDDVKVLCSQHLGYVSVSRTVTLHGGRGFEKSVTCIPCMRRIARGWAVVDCPFCTGAAERVLRAIEQAENTGQTVTRHAVPNQEIPPHRPGCPYDFSSPEGETP